MNPIRHAVCRAFRRERIVTMLSVGRVCLTCDKGWWNVTMEDLARQRVANVRLASGKR